MDLASRSVIHIVFTIILYIIIYDAFNTALHGYPFEESAFSARCRGFNSMLSKLREMKQVKCGIQSIVHVRNLALTKMTIAI